MKPPPPFPALLAAGEEVRTDRSYYFDNAARGDAASLVIQLTLAGAGFWQDATGRRLVPVGHAMLFTHQEPTAYGYPPDGDAPYRLCFLAVSPAPGATALFAALRGEFGSVVPLASGEGRALFDELVERYQKRQFDDPFREAELIYRLLLTLLREQVRGTLARDPIEFGYHYLHHRYRTPLSLKEIAARCGVSREHFTREFTRRYGEPPARQLRRLRLEHARATLQAGAGSLAEVAVTCGFGSESTFRRAYQQHFGHPPSRTA